VAGPSDKGKTVAAPAAKAAAVPEPAPVAVKKSNMGMIAAAVIGVAVLGGGGYFIVSSGGKGATKADSSVTVPAQGKDAPTGTATPGSGVTQMKTPLNPTGGGVRTQGTAPAGGGASPAPAGGAALVAKWMPQRDELTKGTAQQLLNELEPAIVGLSGESKGNAYYLVAMAYFKLDNSSDGCSMFEKAKPLVKGSNLEIVNTFLEQCK
jgi:hypothetical protein